MEKSTNMVELQAKHMQGVIDHLNSSMRQTKEYYLETYKRLPPKVVELEMFTEKVIKLVRYLPNESTDSIEVKLARLKEKIERFSDDYKVYVLNNLVRAYEVELIYRRAHRGQQITHR